MIHTPLVMTRNWAERIREITNYGRFINQFPPNIIRSIRHFERIDKNYVDKKCLLCSIKFVSMKKCCQNNIYIYIYNVQCVYIHTHIYDIQYICMFNKLTEILIDHSQRDSFEPLHCAAIKKKEKRTP